MAAAELQNYPPPPCCSSYTPPYSSNQTFTLSDAFTAIYCNPLSYASKGIYCTHPYLHRGLHYLACPVCTPPHPRRLPAKWHHLLPQPMSKGPGLMKIPREELTHLDLFTYLRLGLPHRALRYIRAIDIWNFRL